MRIFSLLLVLLAACSTAPVVGASGGVYYIDSVTGDDAHTGLSPDQAWATLEKVNSHTFGPGDRILFKAGTRYEGQFKPTGSGREGAPIIVNSYGEGPKPRLDGEGRYEATVHLYNVEYWEVNNLEITNTGKERKARRRGVILEAWNYGEAHHLYLDSLSIHDVNGSLVKSEGGGSAILWKNGGDEVKSRFVDLRIENSHLYMCERNGINSRGYTRRDEWYPTKGVVIRNNLLEQIPGDGIVPIGTDGTLIEHNTLRNFPITLPRGEAAAGIWPWSSDNTVIQYNEVSGHNAPWDAQGYDSDWNSRNTLIQYNYSYNNAGGFLLICNNGENYGTDRNIGTTNTVVRYNVSVNDGLRRFVTRRDEFFSPTFHMTGPVKGSKIYNNIIFIPPKTDENVDRTLVELDNWGGPWPEDVLFANNIFVSQDTVDFDWGQAQNVQFSHNLFSGEFRNLPDDPHAIFEEPRFVNPYQASRGLETLKAFKLLPGSPGINAGIKINDGPGEDFFGSTIEPNEKVSLGIQEFDDKTNSAKYE